MTETEREGRHFAWRYNPRQGYGWILRKADGAESALITGDDATDLRRQFNRLASKTASPRYPAAAPTFAEVFDAIASDYIHDA